MGELVVVENVTLDGVMQAPGGAEEDTRGDFRFGGWARPYADHVAAAAGLVDRYILSIHPLTLGAGTRLFGDPAYRGRCRWSAP